MMGKYTILVTDSSGNTIADISDHCLTRAYEEQRNRPSGIRLSFNVYDLEKYFGSINQTIREVFYVNVNEIHIYRYGSHIAAGQISYFDISVSGSSPIATVYVDGWLNLFNYAVTGSSQTYSATDIGEIMWDLIDTFQTQSNANFGITEGLIQTSRNADRSYEYKNIKDAIIQLSEVQGGPDFEITPDKVFNVFYPKIGRQRDDIVFTIPGNIIEIGYSIDGAKQANQIIAEGSGTGSQRLISVATDTATTPTYKLRVKRVQYPDVSIQTTLDNHASEDLRTYTNPYVMPKLIVDGGVDPVVTAYKVGDEVLVKPLTLQNVLEPMTGYKRIEKKTVKIDNNDNEIVTLTLVNA